MTRLTLILTLILILTLLLSTGCVSTRTFDLPADRESAVIAVESIDTGEVLSVTHEPEPGSPIPVVAGRYRFPDITRPDASQPAREFISGVDIPYERFHAITLSKVDRTGAALAGCLLGAIIGAVAAPNMDSSARPVRRVACTPEDWFCSMDWSGFDEIGTTFNRIGGGLLGATIGSLIGRAIGFTQRTTWTTPNRRRE